MQIHVTQTHIDRAFDENVEPDSWEYTCPIKLAINEAGLMVEVSTTKIWSNDESVPLCAEGLRLAQEFDKAVNTHRLNPKQAAALMSRVKPMTITLTESDITRLKGGRRVDG